MSERATHQHTNPSPSLASGAWCNGSWPDNPGCGQLVPLYAFPKHTWAPYVEEYLQDVRGMKAILNEATTSAVKVDKLRRLLGMDGGDEHAAD